MTMSTPSFTVCPGSRTRAVSFSGAFAKCPECREWVRSTDWDPFVMVTHFGLTPREARNAWSLIMFEYRVAVRERGRRAVFEPEPHRWHVTAAEMMRAGRSR